MSTRVRALTWLLAAVLFAGVLTMLMSSPRQEFQRGDSGTASVEPVVVQCASVYDVGFPGALAYLDGSGLDDDVVDDDVRLGETGVDRVKEQCTQKRETRIAFAVLLAVPTSVVASVAALGGRRRSAQSAL